MDYINDSIRILIIANAVKDKKKLKLTENKIKLYDYYLKFPKTMFENTTHENEFMDNFDEYYAFFHWQPDLIKYRQVINYLIGKGFIERHFDNKTIFFVITENGIKVINSINSSYKFRLEKFTNNILEDIVKLSDTKIEEDIKKKTNTYLKIQKDM
jgi:hypothetical protein